MKIRLISIAFSVLSLVMFGVVSSSEAASITSLSAYATADWGRGGYIYNGSHVVMDSYAYARNPKNNPKAKDPNNNPLLVSPWFRTNEYDAPNGAEIHPEHRDTKDPVTIEVGETSRYFYPGPWTDDDTEFDRWVGTLRKGDGRELYFGAHTHLQVSTKRGTTKVDDWEVDTKQQTEDTAVTFTWEDGP